MSDSDSSNPFGAPFGVGPTPTLEDFQHWTQIMGRAQQLLMEFALSEAGQQMNQTMLAKWMDPSQWAGASADMFGRMPQTLASVPAMDPKLADPLNNPFLAATTSFWQESVDMWQSLATGQMPEPKAGAAKDRRFAAPEWTEHPLFAFIRQSYALISEKLLAAADGVDGVDPKTKAQMRFATANLVDAMSPSNFALTNPAVLKRTMETRGENLVKGLEHMLADLKKGQLTHVDESKFELGVNIATTPGKVIHETPMYQLIHYAPTTEEVFETPLLIFPPWINRFYILDLNPEKSFIRWAVEQGLSVFIVSWKSADESMKDVIWDDYIAAQIDAIATVTQLLGVKSTHTIGYCVAGTTLAATLALLTAHGEADKVKSATFFTAQVDFSEAGDLNLMVDDQQLALLEQLSAPGYLDGRYMAATFNALRGRDLIWNYVVNNYLMGEDYPPFDLLYWNGDTTNLPAKWHKSYLTDLYRDNRLVVPGSIHVEGTPIDLTKVKTPTYVQAGREDHIAPAPSVWKIMDQFSGPKRFLLAGSGHIAGVVNPPSAGKYQHWINEEECASLDEFIAGAREVKGSWWPDWIQWIAAQDGAKVPTKGARLPGKGKLKAIEDAPGRYVKAR
ncbi:class I poly(R)-hydroxyalkanoic acid synthase [Sphingomonas lacunae]|uniref:Class I poly(R)-hydroxyalkanoic acid synthase n=1 Tax=Sphingomonas lacunae TaxID=2698828 RepID=A0A6M4AVQ7_9SPHN|nr:class I poly(R)-hydroxyalkanoic acid synthase [Sphingomonas lacunae]QJQ32480.1 class I poly(R)-hydroxyalkanoic acid synthase [Sphingomonas lacunae]